MSRVRVLLAATVSFGAGLAAAACLTPGDVETAFEKQLKRSKVVGETTSDFREPTSRPAAASVEVIAAVGRSKGPPTVVPIAPSTAPPIGNESLYASLRGGGVSPLQTGAFFFGGSGDARASDEFVRSRRAAARPSTEAAHRRALEQEARLGPPPWESDCFQFVGSLGQSKRIPGCILGRDHFVPASADATIDWYARAANRPAPEGEARAEATRAIEGLQEHRRVVLAALAAIIVDQGEQQRLTHADAYAVVDGKLHVFRARDLESLRMLVEDRPNFDQVVDTVKAIVHE